MPWRIPVYDSFVRLSLGVPQSWDHPEAYTRVTQELFKAAREHATESPAWMGSLEPRSPLRAFDKWFWWKGGGSSATAVEVKNPWRAVDELGLERV